MFLAARDASAGVPRASEKSSLGATSDAVGGISFAADQRLL